MNPDDEFLELCQLLREARKLIETERTIVFESHKERDGQVRDYEARKLIGKYDRWLRRSRKVLA